MKENSLFDPAQMRVASIQAFIKLNPVTMIKNPVMFTVEIGTAIMLIVCISILFGADSQGSIGYNATIFAILFATLWFANFAEAIAEARGKAQANSLRKTREKTLARQLLQNGEERNVQSSELKKGDCFICESGDSVPMDGEIIQGIATIDESAITGESAPVIREAGGDKSSVTGGTKVLSDRIVVQVTADPGDSFLDKMIALVEGASRQKTPNEIALTILLAAFTLIFIIVCVTLKPFADFANAPITIAAFISLFVCLIPTTIGGLLSAIGIAGMDRALRANVITKSGKAVETAGDIDVLLLDKTGTITIGNRKATNFFAAPGVSFHDFLESAVLSSLSDDTPEGKSVIELASVMQHDISIDLKELSSRISSAIKFTAETRTSGVILKNGTDIR
ncbi:MAG: potassium-transporting ATPase subunit B, partial [Chitinophagaceae bacterium]